MPEQSKPELRDGRLSVVLLLLCALGLVCGLRTIPFRTASSFPRDCERLTVDERRRLVIDGCLAAGQGEVGNEVPTRYAPVLFELIPINRADRELLMTVKGIGPVLADTIITYRRRFGPIAGPKVLSGLPGIGPQRAGRLARDFSFDVQP